MRGLVTLEIVPAQVEDGELPGFGFRVESLGFGV